MKRLLGLPTGFASRICALCTVLPMLTSAAALAQSTNAANPPPAPAQSSVPDEAGSGCEPIGLTASGEVVFPFRCKGVIELQRAAATKPADPTPAPVASVVQEKPQEKPQEKLQEKLQAQPQAQPVAAAAKTAAIRHPASVAPANAKRTAQPVDVTHSLKSAETKPVDAKPVETKPVETTKGIQQVAGAIHEHGAGPPGCTQFQSYNAVSATYLGFDGQRHPCHAVVGQVARNQVAGNQAARTQASHKPSPADIKH